MMERNSLESNQRRAQEPAAKTGQPNAESLMPARLQIPHRDRYGPSFPGDHSLFPNRGG